MSENASLPPALSPVPNDSRMPLSFQFQSVGAGSHTTHTARDDERLFPSAKFDACMALPVASSVGSLDAEETAQQQQQQPRRRKIAWECGMCGYHVLAMDHEGNPLPFSVSSFGELLPMGCPRCQLDHTNWVQVVPFNEHGDHTNIRSKLTNTYFRTVMRELERDEKSLHPQPHLQPQPQPTQPPSGAPAGSEGALPEILQQIGRYTYKDGVPVPTAPKVLRKRGDRMSYYCSHCNRQLLRMDPYGELVPMVRDKDGTTLPIVCPGCKVEHNQWEVKPYTFSQGAKTE